MNFLWYGLVELVLIVVILFLFYGIGSLKKKPGDSRGQPVEKEVKKEKSK